MCVCDQERERERERETERERVCRKTATLATSFMAKFANPPRLKL